MRLAAAGWVFTQSSHFIKPTRRQWVTTAVAFFSRAPRRRKPLPLRRFQYDRVRTASLSCAYGARADGTLSMAPIALCFPSCTASMIQHAHASNPAATALSSAGFMSFATCPLWIGIGLSLNRARVNFPSATIGRSGQRSDAWAPLLFRLTSPRHFRPASSPTLLQILFLHPPSPRHLSHVPRLTTWSVTRLPPHNRHPPLQPPSTLVHSATAMASTRPLQGARHVYHIRAQRIRSQVLCHVTPAHYSATPGAGSLVGSHGARATPS